MVEVNSLMIILVALGAVISLFVADYYHRLIEKKMSPKLEPLSISENSLEQENLGSEKRKKKWLLSPLP